MSEVEATRTLVESFYSAFAERDHLGMAACYHPEIEFSDPVFPRLVGSDASAMWRMLCERGTDLQLTWEILDSDAGSARVLWVADYTFSTTGRMVNNRIEAKMRIEDGAIRHHVDHFDFWRWSRQALGPIGVLLGWTPFLKTRVRRMAAFNLKRFLENEQSTAANPPTVS